MRTIPPMKPIIQQLDTSGLKWLDFTKAIPFEYTQINEWKAWLYFIRGMTIWVGLVWAGWQLFQLTEWNWFHYGLSLGISVGIFCCYANLFVLAHDCAHFSFSKIKIANKIVGHFILSFVHVGFHNWKIAHNFHHTYSQCINKDTTWTKDKLTVQEFAQSDVKKKKDYQIAYSTPIGLLVGYYVACFNYFFFKRHHWFIPLETEHKKQLFFSSALVVLISLAQFSLFYYWGGVSFYFNYHCIPVFLGGITAVGIPLLQHSHENAVYFDEKSWSPLRGQILGTYNFRAPYIWERIFNDVNLHIVHHLNPKVPWYNLRPSYNELKLKFPEYVFEYDLTWDALKKIYSHPVVEWNNQLKLYTSAPIADPTVELKNDWPLKTKIGT